MSDGNRELYQQIIRIGKRSDKFAAIAKERKHKGDKYKNVNNIEKSGAVTFEDAMFLYNTIAENKISCVVEVGTWFGTSAIFMAKAMYDNGIEGKVYTCDQHDVYIEQNPYSEHINYRQMWSEDFFNYLIKKRIQAQFLFVDATLGRRDAKKIKKFLDQMHMAFHDWTYGTRKGKRSFNIISSVNPGIECDASRPTELIGYFKEKT